MIFNIKYQYFFPAVGERFYHTWEIEADFTVDADGEHLTICGIDDKTLGVNHGAIDFTTHGTGDVPKDLLIDIFSAGIRAGAKALRDHKTQEVYEFEH